MTTPLLDFAARPQSAPRCLVLAESDRARTGSSVAVLFRDPSTTSPYWPLALAAYRRIWSGYKAHAPVMSATALLTQVADTLAGEPELLDRPDLVAAFASVESGELAAWGLGTALVLVRQGEDLLELEAGGFTNVPAAGPIARTGEGRGLWHGRLEVGPGTSVCLVERATAARLGWWRLRHALGGASGEEILAELGLADDVAVAGRVIRSPLAAGAPPAPLESRFVSGPPAVISAPSVSSAPAGSLPNTSPAAFQSRPAEIPSPGGIAPPPPTRWSDRRHGDQDSADREFLIRGRRQGEERQLSWLGGSNRGRTTDPADIEDRLRAEHRPETEERSGTTEAPLPHRSAFESIEPAEPARPERNWLSPLAAGPESAAGTPFILGNETPIGEAEAAKPEVSKDDAWKHESWTDEAWKEAWRPKAEAAEAAKNEASPTAESGFMLSSRRARRRSGGTSLRDSLASWTAETLDSWSSPDAARGGGERTMLRRAVAWTILGGSAIVVVAFLILVGRFLTAPRPEGDALTGVGLTAEKGAAPEAAGGSSPNAPDPAHFSGASWTHRLPQAITSSPLIYGDRLIVGCRDGNLYALALADGSELWRLSGGSGIGSSPVAAGSMVIVGTYGGDVIAVDAATGSERWRTATGGKIVSSPAFLAGAGIVTIGSHDHHVYGIQVKDGAVRWKAKTGDVVWASPTVAGKRVLVGSHDGGLYCLNGESGRVEWRAEVGGAITASAGIWRDRVIIGSPDRKIRAFDLSDGKPLWTQPTTSPVGGAVVAADKVVLVGTDSGELLALAGEDGSPRYRVRTGGPIKSRPVVSEGQVWFTSYDGRLRVVDLESGRDLWSFKASGRLFSSPAVLGRTAFFGSMNGTLYAATWAVDRAGL